jgi:hypothetical protein
MPGAHPLPVFRQVFDSILAAQATRPSQGK